MSNEISDILDAVQGCIDYGCYPDVSILIEVVSEIKALRAQLAIARKALASADGDGHEAV